MPGIDYRELRTRISMAQVLKLLGFQPLKVRGAQLRGYCPVHRVSPRAGVNRRHRQKQLAPFSVDLDKQVYRCFQCGSNGNALDLWASARKLPIYAAAIDLCQALKITPPPLHTLRTGHRSQHT
jgi:DNA primase